jgi:hypothetical protein
MSLKDEFIPDFIDTFSNPDEFGEGDFDNTGKRTVYREFMFVNKIFNAKCVWDRDHLKQRFIVQQQGVFIGDVMLHIEMSHFDLSEDVNGNPIRQDPKPEEIIYSPKEIGWIISEVTEVGDVYEIALTKLLT